MTQGGGGGTGSPATQNDATWFDAFYNAADPDGSTGWNLPGAEGNYITTASASTTIEGGQGALTAYDWTDDGLVSDVQGWIDHPASNFGWMLKGDESGSIDTTMRFQSADSPSNGTGGTINALPMITITYAAPEPTSLTIGGGIAVFCALKRRGKQ
jgi:hypothetical protein